MPEGSDNNTLEGLVCQNRTREAIEQLKTLIEHVYDEHVKSLVGLLGRYSAVDEAMNEGTSQREMTNTETNRIRSAFLNILSDVREELQTKINFFKPIPRAAEERGALRDFIESVLSRKFDDIKAFTEGNSFIYFSAKEKHSLQDVMIMVFKSNDVEDIVKNSQLKRISRLKHRNLIQLLDVNFQTYPFYLITEFVYGVNLKTIMATTGAFPLYNAKRLLMIIGDVMNYLRQKRFAHSGIRPSKILIDHELEPEISPFDILRDNEEKRMASTFLEDSYYFAPERLHGIQSDSSDATDKANQFCLAALAYHMLTGEKLFKGTNLSETLLARYRFFNDLEVRKAKLAHPRLPKRLAGILKRMLQEQPSKRYDDLASALNAISRVRSTRDKSEELMFTSYRRCLVHSDNFIEQFYDNLYADPAFQGHKPESSEEKALQYQNFHVIVHLLFDAYSASSFMERMARLSPGKTNVAAEYTLMVEVFIKTVSQCDPRWRYRSDIKAAWHQLRDHIVETLRGAVPITDRPVDPLSPAPSAPAAPETVVAEQTLPSDEEPDLEEDMEEDDPEDASDEELEDLDDDAALSDPDEK
ncbi:MAG: protein kinase [Lewinellaceae bacterium]|nr:protein kinase [Lewinellaceae bacterium]MCB9356280.1 protein kinase [Lewinellaceae bacterium]